MAVGDTNATKGDTKIKKIRYKYEKSYKAQSKFTIFAVLKNDFEVSVYRFGR